MPATAPEFEIAVVGTGVVGLAAALGCAQRGLRVALIGPAPQPFEPTPQVPFDARIYALSPSSVALLERIRAWPQVDGARVQPVARMRVFGDAGGELTFDAYAAALERLATIVEEGALLRALWLGCRMTPGIEHLATGFEGAQFEPGGARLRLSGAASIECALLLGADGKNSPVRSAAGIRARATPYGHTALVANFACGTPHRGTAWQWFSDEGVLALLPLPGERVSLVWSAPESRAARMLSLPPAEFAALVGNRSGQALGALQLLGGVHRFPLQRVEVDRVAQPRVALLGDAAHVVHPLAGQGLNLGLQDVSELLRVLAGREAWRDLGDRMLLRRYERARAEPIGLMRLTVDGLAKLFGTQDPLVRQLRNFGLGLVDGLAPVKNALIRRAIG
ncbi:MAG TPA: UbiH/UbiF family hydroxylase [Burkholderiaceae bacterium]